MDWVKVINRFCTAFAQAKVLQVKKEIVSALVLHSPYY